MNGCCRFTEDRDGGTRARGSHWGHATTAVLAVMSVGLMLLLLPAVSMAQEQSVDVGQNYLNEAIQQKLSARSMDDLAHVIALCEKALAAGLSEDSAEFAKSLLAGTLYEHASRIADEILERDPPNRRWPVLRQIALRDLEKALLYDPEHGEVQLLIARLDALPQGNRTRGKAAAEAAVRLLTEEDHVRSSALVMRARYSEDDDQRRADYAEAIRLDPRNVDAWRDRGVWQLGRGEVAKAVEDFLKLLELVPDDISGLQAVATALFAENKLDDALNHVNKAIELAPDMALGYKLRAQIQAGRDKKKAALDDLNHVLEIQPGDISAMAMRARLWMALEQFDFALADIERALDLDPDFSEAILLRSSISARQGRLTDAIRDLRLLIQKNPDHPQNKELLSQIAGFYYLDDQPSKSIEVCNEMLADNPDDWQALRLRGDASLLVGKHSDAVKDYESALKTQPDDSGVLNNLAWVLATSPDDSLRSGQRSIELATKACEATEYKAPHILSTLAAGYAETGDFDTAIEWSTKAVQQAREEIASLGESSSEMERLSEQLKQLENELSSYQQKKPWRELINKEQAQEAVVPNVGDLELDRPEGQDHASAANAADGSTPKEDHGTEAEKDPPRTDDNAGAEPTDTSVSKGDTPPS